jgi:hypothetical protein
MHFVSAIQVRHYKTITWQHKTSFFDLAKRERRKKPKAALTISMEGNKWALLLKTPTTLCVLITFKVASLERERERDYVDGSEFLRNCSIIKPVTARRAIRRERTMDNNEWKRWIARSKSAVTVAT